MHKLLKVIWILTFILALSTQPQAARAGSSAYAPVFSDASDLIAGVNAIRSSNGLNTLQTNSILNSIAQQQAAYELSIGSQTDTGPGGTRPYQRALAAGYLLAGDLSEGGFIAELLYGGVGIGPSVAVTWWNNDPYHHSMLVSTSFADVGAGVATSGNTSYFVLVEALSTGGKPVAYTPPAPLNPSTPTIVPNTPNADGSIVHIVQPGETLGSLSMAYNVPLADILSLNNLTLTSTIFVNEKITIRAAYTLTPTQPTSTPTIPPTMTPWPTSTPTPTATNLPPTSTPSPGLPVSAAGGAVTAIVVAALILAGLIAVLGRKRN
ncbi:MAG: CAP domain-containing protein [Anaerolineales bacterium]